MVIDKLESHKSNTFRAASGEAFTTKPGQKAIVNQWLAQSAKPLAVKGKGVGGAKRITKPKG